MQEHPAWLLLRVALRKISILPSSHPFAISDGLFQGQTEQIKRERTNRDRRGDTVMQCGRLGDFRISPRSQKERGTPVGCMRPESVREVKQALANSSEFVRVGAVYSKTVRYF